MIKNCQKQSGFSLIETVLVTVLMLVVFTVFGAFMLRFQKSAAQFNERAKQNEDSGMTTQTVINDVERTGANLTLSEKQSFTGKVFVPFQSNPNYEVSGHRITRSRGRSESPLLANVLWGGKGELKWRGNSFSVIVSDAHQSRQFYSDSADAYIYENNEQVQSVPVDSSDPLFSITISSVVINGSAVCRTLYKIDERLIYESSQPCAESPQEINLNIPVGGYVDEMELNAAEIVLRESETFPVRLPVLPLYNENQMSSPFVKTANGFLIFSGDDKQNMMFLSRDHTIYAQEADYFDVNNASGLEIGDGLLICDYLNNRSVLLQILTITDNTLYASILYKNGIGQGNFEKFVVPAESFDGAEFQRGTRVVKLALPVEYRSETEDDITSLYRRSGNSAWELVVSDIQNFSVSQDITPSRASFDISFDVKSEGVESGQIAQPVRLSVSPRSLNRTYDAR
jgi:type II secretory pathway pseudopilin PulG